MVPCDSSDMVDGNAGRRVVRRAADRVGVKQTISRR